MTGPLRLLAIFPHPDDETMGVGTTLAKYAAEGVDVYLVCATRGEYGWTGAPDENPGPQAIGRIRESELRCAAAELGLKEVCLLDTIDGQLDQAQPEEMIKRLVSYIRRVRPQVVLTFGADGAYGHPDHIALAQFTAAALVCAADAQFDDDDSQPPFRAVKFYQMVKAREQVELWNEKVGLFGMEVDGVMRRLIPWEPWIITTRIDGRETFDRFLAAMHCHQSQLAGFGSLVDLPRETQMELFAEGTFVRVYSLVNAGRAVEKDLFEGLR